MNEQHRLTFAFDDIADLDAARVEELVLGTAAGGHEDGEDEGKRAQGGGTYWLLFGDSVLLGFIWNESTSRRAARRSAARSRRRAIRGRL